MGRPSGIEPPLAVPQTAVLTITPRPPYIELLRHNNINIQTQGQDDKKTAFTKRLSIHCF